jgi:hypothetical protein
MTRKDYELFAKMLREVPSAAKRLDFAAELVKVFAADNERFNEATFRNAADCKVSRKGEYAS